VFPVSNWTELDVVHIDMEDVPVPPLYFAQGEVVVRGDLLISVQSNVRLLPGQAAGKERQCRLRSLGCTPCRARSNRMRTRRRRLSRNCVGSAVQAGEPGDRPDQDGSMELKKREGYF
jgi:sulfate adenylyltransferase subunit 2